MVGFDGTADDGVQVFVFERDGDNWRRVHGAGWDTYEPAPAPDHHHWSEVNWVETAEGWARTYAEGEFTMTDEIRGKLLEVYRRAVEEGKLQVWSTGVLDQLGEHIRRAKL